MYTNPITNQIKGYPFEVAIPRGVAVTGAVLSDQVKSLDWKARRAELIGTLPHKVIDNVLDKVRTLL
jgi:mRNA interferase MazF